MRFLWLASIVWSSLLLAGNPEQDINVNTRYTVESVDIAGDNPAGLSTGLRGELTRLARRAHPAGGRQAESGRARRSGNAHPPGVARAGGHASPAARADAGTCAGGV